MPAPHPTPPAKPTKVHNPEHFAAQLRTLAQEHGVMAMGRLQILGFQAIETRLGKRWPLMQDRIEQAIEDALKRRLTERDIYRRYGSLVYLVIFADLSLEEARVKAHFIAEEVWQQLFGMSEPEDGLDVSLLTLNLETSEVERADNLDSLLERQFEAAALQTASLHASPAPVGKQEIRPVRPAAKRPVTPPPAAGEEQAQRPPAPVLAEAAAVPTQTALSFAPVWTVKLSAVTSYYSRMRLVRDPKEVSYGHDILRRSASPRDMYDFDLATLARVQASAIALSRIRSPALLICPVHYTTLINREARQEYLSLCAALPKQAARHLIIEVCGLAEGFPEHTAHEIHRWLRPYARAIWAQVVPLPAAIANLKDVGFAAIGFDMRQLGGTSRLVGLAPLLVHAARKAGKRTYIHDINSHDATMAAVEAGFDFLIGDAIHRPFNKIHAPYRLKIDEIGPAPGA